MKINRKGIIYVLAFLAVVSLVNCRREMEPFYVKRSPDGQSAVAFRQYTHRWFGDPTTSRLKVELWAQRGRTVLYQNDFADYSPFFSEVVWSADSERFLVYSVGYDAPEAIVFAYDVRSARKLHPESMLKDLEALLLAHYPVPPQIS